MEEKAKVKKVCKLYRNKLNENGVWNLCWAVHGEEREQEGYGPGMRLCDLVDGLAAWLEQMPRRAKRSCDAVEVLDLHGFLFTAPDLPLLATLVGMLPKCEVLVIQGLGLNLRDMVPDVLRPLLSLVQLRFIDVSYTTLSVAQGSHFTAFNSADPWRLIVESTKEELKSAYWRHSMDGELRRKVEAAHLEYFAFMEQYEESEDESEGRDLEFDWASSCEESVDEGEGEDSEDSEDSDDSEGSEEEEIEEADGSVREEL